MTTNLEIFCVEISTLIHVTLLNKLINCTFILNKLHEVFLVISHKKIAIAINV